MSTIIYKAKPGARITDRDAAVIGPVMAQIAKENGGHVVPEQLLEAATPPDAALHRFFEWDDGLAAAAHRLQQARNLFRAVVTIVEGPEGTSPVECRAFFHVHPEEGPPAYVTVSSAFHEASYRDQLLERAVEQIKQWRSQYKTLKTLSELFEAIDAFLEQMAQKRKRARRAKRTA